MRKQKLIMAALLVAAAAAGCTQGPPGRSRVLGNVAEAAAFATSKEILSQYFTVDSADPQTAVIKSGPKLVPPGPVGLAVLDDSPARKLATLRLRRHGGQVVAHLSIAIQRQGSAVRSRFLQTGENYDSIPDETPAQIEAATTTEQNELWQTTGYDHVLAGKILRQIYDALNPPSQRH